MKTKVLQVFYGADALPYKDKERTVHFPIVGNAIQNANNTTQIKFYFDRIVEENEQTTFVAVSKLPNGKIGSKILETYDDKELSEQYALLDLDSFYTQYKGDVFISLQGYQGGVRVEQDEQGIYQIYGTPVIAATGSIKLAINYAPSFVGSGETENVTLQQVLGELSTKLGVRQETLHVEELPAVGNPDIWYVVNDNEDDPNKQNIYIWNATTQDYIWVGDNTLDLGQYYTKEKGQEFEEEINQRITNVENTFNGSPKGVYATLAALQAAYPTGTTGIYVVSADGHWYYWNGSAWTDGGVYQSAVGVVPETRTIATIPLTSDIATDKLNLQLFKNGLSGNNKVNYERALGRYIFYSNGAIGSSGNYFQAWFIYKPTFKYIRAFVQNNDTGLAAIAFYNSINIGADSYMKSASVQISSSSSAGVVETAKVPDGCQAVVISSRNDNITPNIWFSDDEFSTFDERLHFVVSCSAENTKTWGYGKVLTAGTIIKIVVNTWNYTTQMPMYLYGGAETYYSIMLNGVGNYYWKLPFNCTGVYMSNVSGNITYDIYTVENQYANFSKSNDAAYPFLRLSTKVFNIVNSTNKYNVTQGGWLNNNTTGAYKDVTSTTRLATQRLKFSGGRVKITFSGSGYNYALGEITNDKIDWLVSDTGWVSDATKYFTITSGRDFVVSFKKSNNANLTYQDLLDDNVSLTIECDELYNNLNNYFEESLLLEKATKNVEYTEYTKTLYPSYEYKKCSHLLIDKISGSNVIIPSESVFDVRMCARLGFKVVEGNIHKTSDNKYVVIHGEGGKIGGELKDTNGTDISNVTISSTSFAILRGYVYKSLYEKYQVPVSSLEEWLYECKNNNMIPLMNIIDDAQLEIVRGIVGDNFICDKISPTIRQKFKGLGHCFATSYTKATAIALCESIGAPLTIFASDYTGYTDDELKDLIKTIHSYSCMIGIVGAYSNEAQVQRCMQLGFDADATGYAVNQFNNGNLANLSNDLTYADFSHNGTVTDGLLTLATGQTLGLQSALSSQFLAKVQLRIVFNGTLNITLGGYVNSTQLTSDGTKECIISTYVLNGTPTLSLTAVANTDIISIDYKASKC